MSDKLKGTVKWFDPKKGYGFIEKEEGTDIFCHFSSIITDGFKTLNNGQSVEFEIETSDNGEKAINIHPLDK